MFGRYVKSLYALQSYLLHISPLNIASYQDAKIPCPTASIKFAKLSIPRAERLVGGLVCTDVFFF